jgi:nitrite reductase/ring-hydroxylating ferredoxin subunit
VSEWAGVGDVSTLEREGRIVARIGGRAIGVVLAPDGTPRALRNRCPHHGAPLCLGVVQERVAADLVGSYRLTGEPILRCPWHGWEFDLESGRCVEEPSLRVAVYPVKVEDGRIFVRA